MHSPSFLTPVRFIQDNSTVNSKEWVYTIADYHFSWGRSYAQVTQTTPNGYTVCVKPKESDKSWLLSTITAIQCYTYLSSVAKIVDITFPFLTDGLTRRQLHRTSRFLASFIHVGSLLCVGLLVSKIVLRGINSFTITSDVSGKEKEEDDVD